jgi:MarR family transcriptional regulator, temperature-dependent positive regulator of motility
MKSSPASAARPATGAADPAGVILDETDIRIGYRVSYLANFYSGPIYRALEAEEDLTRPDVIVMFCLAHCGSLTAQDISNMTGRPKNSLSRAVHRLLARGFITRVAAARDPRQALLDLTELGFAAFRRILPRFRMREEAMLEPLTEAERREFDRLLGKLVHRSDGWASA